MIYKEQRRNNKMALQGKENFPNLKICIDIEESGEDMDELSLTEEPEIDIDSEGTDKRVLKSVITENSAHASPALQHEDAESGDVQFNVYLNKLDPPKKDIPTLRVFCYVI